MRAFCAWSVRRDLPVYAVGAATAVAARTAGFVAVVYADGDVADLARLILERRPHGLVLHPCGRDRSGDLAGALAARSIPAVTLPLYATEAVRALAPAVAERLATGGLEAVLVHSPKAGRVLATLLAGREGVAGLQVVGLSPACVRPLEPLGLAARSAAATPDEEALLDRLG